MSEMGDSKRGHGDPPCAPGLATHRAWLVRLSCLAVLVFVAPSGCTRPSEGSPSPAPSASASAARVASGSAPARALEQPAWGYGAVMAEVARRFELVGKAIRGGRWELASYEVDEIDETFEAQIPLASPPKEGHPEVLPALAEAFRTTTLPDLSRALAARDERAATAAFARTASTCNGCHHASGHAFIEVPTTPGERVPVTSRAAIVDGGR